ncbi:AAA family ATPase [Aestuariirhabdus litorea]|uniref:DUF2813 domain-containing protein n=1 Tax=Aestuariirhabdus litorea TaxID=2528527 RepID=A0A3P3VME6_9GAMM|nr:ATP-binding protein [Aestuariirhabdus litorea]RRJ83941.1 hypothetical protein D0544_02130 [Aestuariirhabdus litorea]RWW97162.1 hypothetical protein DZC74_02130 [Endozoicomonadaceae bacterium GTF-13]
MDLTSIEVESFKQVKKAEVVLDDINVLVGGNNSGKSSVLQGIHFSVVAAVAARRLDKKTFTQDNLLYCPTKSFVDLRHGLPYQNQSNFGYLRVRGVIDGDDETYTVRVYRGRNEGNVGCERTGHVAIGNAVSSFIPPFSIYVPGLAGIPQVEQYCSESVVRKGVASGDANLYLRNVLLLIETKKLLPELADLMRLLFPEFSILINFDPVHDSHIHVEIGLKKYGDRVPLGLVGTGVLQALQIFSYVTLFKPKLLLLDEPDSHLHPDNQALLAESLKTVADQFSTKIILATHSRHLVDSLYGDANFVWMKGGQVEQQGTDLHRMSMLMDLGALDSFDKLLNGGVDFVILTEDAKLDFILTLVASSGFDMSRTNIYSYKSSGNLHSAGALTEFISELAPETKVIIHADNDFLTDAEEAKLCARIKAYGAISFVTEGSDIEHYFVEPQHIAEVANLDPMEVEHWLDQLAEQFHNRLTHKFSRKRDDAKRKLYKLGENPPRTIGLMGEDVPLPPEKRLGKFMLAKVSGGFHDRFGVAVNLCVESDYLYSETLQGVLE